MPRQGGRALRGGARGAAAGGRSGVGAVDRLALRAALDAAVVRLVTRAAAERWPIRADHCFLRVAYDTATGAKWDSLHARPAWRSLPLDRLAAAIAVLERIETEGLAALVPLNAASLAFRRVARRSPRG